MTPELVVWVDKIELDLDITGDDSVLNIHKIEKPIDVGGNITLKFGVGASTGSRHQIANTLRELADAIEGAEGDTPKETT